MGLSVVEVTIQLLFIQKLFGPFGIDFTTDGETTDCSWCVDAIDDELSCMIKRCISDGFSELLISKAT